jgi:predicted TIM-barrel fold metal-dependent hydrolase
MQGKIALEEHFAIESTLGDSHVFGSHVWKDLSHRLLDIQETRLGEMDKHGIEMMILSLNAPAIQAIHDVKTAIATARQANDALAGEVQKRPGRFAAFAAIPMQDPDAAAVELTRCVKDLGMVGALVMDFRKSAPLKTSPTTIFRNTVRSGAPSRRLMSRFICIRAIRFQAGPDITRGTAGCSAQTGRLPPRPPCTR